MEDDSEDRSRLAIRALEHCHYVAAIPNKHMAGRVPQMNILISELCSKSKEKNNFLRGEMRGLIIKKKKMDRQGSGGKRQASTQERL